MALIKRFVCFFYAVFALVFGLFCGTALYLPFSSDPRLAHRFAHASPVTLIFVALLCALVAAVFGMAWHTVRRGRESARYWVIFPSLFFLLFGCAGLYRHPSAFVGSFLFLLAGVAGPVMAWRKRTRAISIVPITMPAVKGDGTSNLLNKAGSVFAVVSYFGALALWDQWLKSQGLKPMRHGILVLLAVILISVFFHELGHTVIGLAFKMKLRAFAAGPFHWQISDGRWTFKFNLAEILNMGGVTGMVPSTSAQPEWEQIAMIAAGPLTNLYLGVLTGALAMAMATRGSFPLAYTDLLGLFAIISLEQCFTNLIPLRSGTGYSDGAQIFQLLSGGPWAAYHRTIALVGSSLVTPLRPRDFNMDGLDQAASGITQGMAGMRLRLFRYSHFLDCGRLHEAGEALKEVEAICQSSQLKVSATVQSVFTFGNAYLLRDRAAARAWWDRVKAAKPVRFNVEYYMGACALHWIEGDLAQANEAWNRLHEKTLRLPTAGNYQFERHVCELLRRVLEGDMTPPEIVEATVFVVKPETVQGVVAGGAPVAAGGPPAPGRQWLYLQDSGRDAVQ